MTTKKKRSSKTKAVPLQECAPPGYVVGGHTPVTIEAQILEVRPLAIKVTQPDLMDSAYGYGFAWLPRSMISEPRGSGHFTVRGKPIKMTIPKWIALDKGLQYVMPGEAGQVDNTIAKADEEGRCPKCGAVYSRDCPECEKQLQPAPAIPYVIDDEREQRLALRDMERDQPSAVANLPPSPRPDRSVDVLDEDLLCDEVP